ncbi:GSCFA domain-containing protein, partial [Desulfosarcina sp.]|uniref:GSCFA domain-containing protein n=1 Tax=Desulfosarcina sp. TaxID=2027861 RepID=UPI003970F2E1
ATLRVAAEYFCGQHENAFYFPSYEITTQILCNPWESDGRHITKNAIVKIMNTFVNCYSG